MNPVVELPNATNGELYISNLEGALDHAWYIHHKYPERPGINDLILDGESIRTQFFGDYSAFDRLAQLAATLLTQKPHLAATHLFIAQVNAGRHLFLAARSNLIQAEILGADITAVARIKLSINQALGEDLDNVLEQRLHLAKTTHAIGDFVTLGALYADLSRYDEANDSYIEALSSYTDLSPLGLAWACFQLGFLWGENADQPDIEKAAYWYSQAINYLPSYTHATVHLAEIYLDSGEYDKARKLLSSVIESGDPEVRWRMSELLVKQNNDEAALKELAVSRHMYEDLLSRHELAFADHAAEFYLGSGNNPQRALQLALANLKNRSTSRAYELAIDASKAAGDLRLSEKLTSELNKKWTAN
jgi:FimV-like protein